MSVTGSVSVRHGTRRGSAAAGRAAGQQAGNRARKPRSPDMSLPGREGHGEGQGRRSPGPGRSQDQHLGICRAVEQHPGGRLASQLGDQPFGAGGGGWRLPQRDRVSPWPRHGADASAPSKAMRCTARAAWRRRDTRRPSGLVACRSRASRTAQRTAAAEPTAPTTSRLRPPRSAAAATRVMGRLPPAAQ